MRRDDQDPVIAAKIASMPRWKRWTGRNIPEEYQHPVQVIVGTIVGMLLVALVLGLLGLVWNKASAAEPTDLTMVQMIETECDGACPYSAKRFKRKFDRGRFDNADNSMVPRKWRKMMNKKTSARIAHRGIDDWWNEKLDEASCFFHSKLRDTGREWECLPNTAKQIDRVNDHVSHTTKVITRCGGMAIFGKYVYKFWTDDGETRIPRDQPGYWKITKKGWQGIAAATTLCATENMWDRWF